MIRKCNRKYWIIAGAVLLLGLSAARLAVQSAGTVQQQTVAAVSIKTAAVSYVEKTPQLLLTGSIEGETSAIVSANAIGANASAKITEVLVDDGQPVNAGQVLIKVESTEAANGVQAAQNRLRSAQANLENIQTNYNRSLALYQQSAISKQQLDSAATQLKVAESDLSNADASLSTAQQQYSYTAVTAPVSGVVANKAAVVGQVVAVGQPLLTVESIRQVYAVVNVEQQDMGRVTAGMPAQISVDAYPGQTFAGRVELINPAAQPANRMFRTKIKIDNAADRLKPGMFVKVALVTGPAARVLAAPAGALLQKQGLYYVFAVEGDRVVRRPVKIGRLLDDKVEITDGLTENMTVAVTNVATLTDGGAVAVVQ